MVTRAQKEAQRLAEEAEKLATYIPRLFKALEAATSFIWSIDFQDGQVKVRTTSDSGGEDYYIQTSGFTFTDVSNLESLEREIEFEKTEREKARRDEELRQAALTKLNAEERRVLGLRA